MRLKDFYERYPTKLDCLERIEKIRWERYGPRCPFCRSERVRKKVVNGKRGRWNCHACKSSFTVLSGMPFNGTHTDLQKWFECINLMLNANRGLSSCDLAELLDLNWTQAVHMKRRIEREIYIGGEKRLRKIIGTSKKVFIKRKKNSSKRSSGKPVIT